MKTPEEGAQALPGEAVRPVGAAMQVQAKKTSVVDTTGFVASHDREAALHALATA
ncbi:hypothetical protein [Pseudoxanthomonas mexicana]